ncbi:MAG: SH3 domain-containing protein [Chloroflexi bacterium]|nr:SH3 domain-containing protein [Chloroflexota bacterium]
MSVQGDKVISGRFGVNLRAAPSLSGAKMGTLREGAQAYIAGKVKGVYACIRRQKGDILNLPAMLPAVIQPEALPAPTEPQPAPKPVHDTTRVGPFQQGLWFQEKRLLSGHMVSICGMRHDGNANNIGFVPGNSHIIVTGPPQGEYTPVRVDDKILQPPLAPATRKPPHPLNPDPGTTGAGEIGCALPASHHFC